MKKEKGIIYWMGLGLMVIPFGMFLVVAGINYGLNRMFHVEQRAK